MAPSERLTATPLAKAKRTAPAKIGVLCADLSMRGGGVPNVVASLYGELASSGEFSVSVLGRNAGSFDGPASLAVADTGGVGTFGYAPKLDRMLDGGEFDLLHTHGLWTYASIAARRWQRSHRRPTLVSPHGMLDKWALAKSATKKKIARVLFEGSHVAHASCLHALNRAEEDSSRAWGYAGPVAVISNGVEMPTLGADRQSDPAGPGVLLFLGRIDPKKGVRELIQAWALLRDGGRLAGWQLVIAGWGEEGYVREMQKLGEELHLGSELRFAGPRFGVEKSETYRAADAFVLPSFSEGMPMTVLEAWSFGLPVLMTRECHLEIGFDRGAAMEIHNDPAVLAAGIGAFIARPAHERRSLGEAGRRLVEAEFSWPSAAAQLADVYRWLLGSGARPPCVAQ